MWRSSSVVMLAVSALMWVGGTPRLALAQDLGEAIDVSASSEEPVDDLGGTGVPSADISAAADDALAQPPKTTPEPLNSLQPYPKYHAPHAVRTAGASKKAKGKKQPKAKAKAKRGTASVKKKVGGKSAKGKKKGKKKKSGKKHKHQK